MASHTETQQVPAMTRVRGRRRIPRSTWDNNHFREPTTTKVAKRRSNTTVKTVVILHNALTNEIEDTTDIYCEESQQDKTSLNWGDIASENRINGNVMDPKTAPVGHIKDPKTAPVGHNQDNLANQARQLKFASPWTLYYDTDWRFRHNIATMATIYDLWAVLNSTGTPSLSPIKCNWSLFRDNIQPEWEDDRNKRGGKWNMDFGVDMAMTDMIWKYLLLGVVGETIDHTNEINGITLHLRPGGIRCALWTVGSSMDKQKVIGAKIREIARVPDCVSLDFKLQSEAIEKNSSYETQVTLKM